LSWTTSARIVAFDCSTHSSIFSRNASIIFGRGSRSNGFRPLARASTYRLTVFGSCPVRAAADQTVSVRSYASNISMISLSDFVTGPLRPLR